MAPFIMRGKNYFYIFAKFLFKKNKTTTTQDLLQSETVLKDKQLKMTTALSLTRIAHQACINETISRVRFPRLVMGQLCTPQIINDKLVPLLADHLNKATDTDERLALLLALGTT